jgi:hypothetical protein
MPKEFIPLRTVTRYVGELKIVIGFVQRSIDNRAEYRGKIVFPKGTWRGRPHYGVWKFEELRSGVGGVSSGKGYGYADTSPEAYDRMAEMAVSFASYYTTDNRGDDAPDWAPPAEDADRIAEAAMTDSCEREGHHVRRSQRGRARSVFRCECEEVI